jgi:hypothetical protein
MNEYMTPRQAGERLSLSARRILQFCREGRLGQLVGERYIITSEELRHFEKIPRKPGRPKNTSPNNR